MDNLKLIDLILSIMASLVNMIALVIAGLTYKNNYASRLKFTHTIGVCFDTGTNSPVYGGSITIKNLAAPTTIENVALSFSKSDKIQTILMPNTRDEELSNLPNLDCYVELKTNALCCYNFKYSEQQLDYFRKNTDNPSEPVRFIVTTAKKEYVVKCKISINQMCLEAHDLYSSDETKNKI